MLLHIMQDTFGRAMNDVANHCVPVYNRCCSLRRALNPTLFASYHVLHLDAIPYPLSTQVLALLTKFSVNGTIVCVVLLTPKSHISTSTPHASISISVSTHHHKAQPYTQSPSPSPPQTSGSSTYSHH
jgi:hypothetical protein